MTTRRALPGRAVDLATDGVPREDLLRNGHKAVYNALVKIAASAMQRGWSEADWSAFIEARALGRQNTTDANGRPANPKQARKRLWKAWDAAAKWVDEQEPPWSPYAAALNAEETADAAVEAIENAENDLTSAERAVLAYAAELATKRGSDALTIARGDAADGTGFLGNTGLGLTAWRTAMKRLDARGALVVARPGERRSKGRPGRATVYRLARLNQSGNPVSGAPQELAVPPSTVPPAVSSAPTPTEETDPMNDGIVLTRAQIVAALGEAAYAQLVAAEQAPAEVRHLRAVGDGEDH